MASRSRWGASTSPVAIANTVSPSHIVCAGVTASDTPSLPACASSCARSLDSPAFVATTTSVVLVPCHVRGSASGLRFSAIGASCSSSTVPSAFTAASAETTSWPSSTEALPRPPFQPEAGSGSLANVAPVPAPTLPSSTGPSDAASQAAYPAASSGRAAASPTARSNSTAAGTIGTRATPASKPIPRSSSQRWTPLAAARPNALPPVSRTAWISFTAVPGRMASVSRVPGAPPLTSTDPLVPGGHRTTVHPVTPARSVTWPTRIPATRVITRSPPARSRALPSGAARPEHLVGERREPPVELLVRFHHREMPGSLDHLETALWELSGQGDG